MKKVFVFALSLWIISGASVFAGQFGPAEPQTKPGQYSLGFGVFGYQDEWDFEDLFVADAKQTQVFVQLNYGLFPKWETYLRAGMANLRLNEVTGFRDDFSPYGTVGIKGLVRRGTYVDMGIFAEGSYFMDYEDEEGTTSMEIDNAFAANAGVIFQKEIEGALLYGGPFLHFREADYTFTNNGVSTSGTVEDNSGLGGLLGIRWMYKDIIIEGEIQLRDKVSPGAAMSFLF